MDKSKLEQKSIEELEVMYLNRVNEAENLEHLHGVPSWKHRDLYLKLVHNCAQIENKINEVKKYGRS